MSRKITPREGAPVLTSLVPPSAKVGDPAFTLHVHGDGFSATDVIVWNAETQVPTTFVSAQELTCDVTMEGAQVMDITVAVQSELGGGSNALTFSVTEPETPSGPTAPIPYNPGPVVPGESNGRAVRIADTPAATGSPIPEPGETNDRAARDGVVPPDQRPPARPEPSPGAVHLEPGASNAGASRDGIVHDDPERARRSWR